MKLTLDTIGRLESNDFLNAKLECQCGKPHSINIDKVIIGKDALNQVPDVVRTLGAKKVLLVADTNTYEVAGKKVASLLAEHHLAYKSYVYKVTRDLVPDEEAVGKLLLQVEKNTDLIVTVGAGTLNDIVKFISRRTNIPSIVVATAPSMDGYASDSSALIIDNLKTSVESSYPKVIIGDTEILKKAPMRMILAGLGDMIGKYSALSDWQVSRIVNKEYYCDVTSRISRDAIQKCVDNIDGVKNREDIAIENVMDGLVRTGIAMSFVGNSRPASGAEHHISHFWEMKFLFEGKEALLHGTKVGLTSIIVARLYEMLIEKQVDFEEAVAKARIFDEKAWRKSISELYGKAAPGILSMSEKDGRNSIEARISRIEVIKENFPQIIEIAKAAERANRVESLMKSAGAPIKPEEVGVDQRTVLDSVLVAKEVRPRYTILNLLSDLGLLEEFTSDIKKYI
ncbi:MULTISPECIES: sn-glycerol-1-phosphate dehydrogenase [Pelosinus]|uniref:L-arabinose utilization protein n=1 Tax=Pelosinus fermentans B4 TaxID=1149862 RepID=I9B4K1_9FIRM|nr:MULTISPECIES: sn-glycerol-1-phosphate dehydrogenase [Pelosinus]EIW20072.1 L-arabinose utilization protein [Pelosinus fermentans B4]EIW26073.1 3-dehydroquinate synthase [Pelosinus fermentans A11]OAM93122.1 Glycerol-1-phosphate dehydrogenase (NAD(P)(+)) [Pelosinus fermentans DSM 17108]SDQ67784.1 glycerol-1-phosphate dehydrogenase [NAD(P)+] [Pelosinus fermentans]